MICAEESERCLTVSKNNGLCRVTRDSWTLTERGIGLNGCRPPHFTWSTAEERVENHAATYHSWQCGVAEDTTADSRWETKALNEMQQKTHCESAKETTGSYLQGDSCIKWAAEETTTVDEN